MIVQQGDVSDRVRWIAAIASPILVTLLVALYAVDVPYWDTWDWLDRHYPTTPTATSMLARYWEPFNGHRVFVSLLLDRALLWASDLAIWPRIALKLPLSLLTLWVVLGLLRTSLPRSPDWLTTASMGALAFPMAYWPMWMDPRQFSMHLVVLALVAACHVASRPTCPMLRTTIAALLCIVASLSYGPGALTWPCVFLVLLLRDPRPRLGVLAAWVALGVVFGGLQVTAAAGAPTFEHTAPPSAWATVHAAAALAGLPVAPVAPLLGHRPTRVMGAVGILLFLALMSLALRAPREARRRMSPWLALGTWGLAYVWTGALTRGGLSLTSLHDPRFVYGSAVLWMAIVAGLRLVPDVMNTSVPTARQSPWGLRLVAIGSWTIGVGLISAACWPFLAPGGISRLHDQLVQGRRCLVTDRLDDDACLERLHPSAAHVRVITLELMRRDAAFLRLPKADQPQPGKDAPVRRH